MQVVHGWMLVVVPIAVLGELAPAWAQDSPSRSFSDPVDQSDRPEANDLAALAWGESYATDLYVKRFEATGYVPYLREAGRRLENMLARRDDRRGVVSCIRRADPGRPYVPWVLPTWRCITYNTYAGLPRFQEDQRTQRNHPNLPDDYWAHPYLIHSARILIAMLRLAELVDRFHLHAEIVSGKTFGRLRDEMVRSSLETVQVHDDVQWRTSGSAGYYVQWPDTLSQPDFSVPERPLPWNRTNSMGIVHLLLFRLTGASVHRDRVSRIAEAFKSGLHLDAATDAYCWTSQADRAYLGSNGEDISHAALSVEFVIEAYREGIVFDFEDVRRLARTLNRRIVTRTSGVFDWADTLDGQGRNRFREFPTASLWLLLGEFADGIYDIGENLLANPGYPGFVLGNLAVSRARGGRVLEAVPIGAAIIRTVDRRRFFRTSWVRVLCNPSWQAVDYERLGDGRARLLWQHRSQDLACLWTLDSADRHLTSRFLRPPYPGFRARSYRELSGGRGFLMWGSDGAATVTELTEGGQSLVELYRREPGWAAVSAEVSSAAGTYATHLLWRHTDGRVELRIQDANGRGELHSFGPYPRRVVRSYIRTVEGNFRMVWDEPLGLVRIWRMDGSHQFQLCEFLGIRRPTSSTAGYAPGW